MRDLGRTEEVGFPVLDRQIAERARARAIRVVDGKQVRGPKALRDAAHVLEPIARVRVGPFGVAPTRVARIAERDDEREAVASKWLERAGDGIEVGPSR